MNAKSQAAVDTAIAELREMPLDKRCDAIISMFSMVVAEFAAMVLEHAEPPKIEAKAKRVMNKLQRKMKRRQ